MKLDRHELAEERHWRLRNYEQAVRRVVTVLVDAIQQETKRALGREIRYDDDLRDAYTYLDQATEIQHAIIQAVNNADFRGLMRDAGDLHAVEMSAHVLAKLKAEVPEISGLLEEREDSTLQARLDRRRAEIETREAQQAVRCRAAVHQEGRGVGFYQCQKRGKQTVFVDSRPGHLGRVVAEGDEHAIEVLVCGIHAKDVESGRIHVFTPSEWEEGQAKIAEAKQRAEIARMEAALPKQITEG